MIKKKDLNFLDMQDMSKKKECISVSEAGRRGGQATFQNWGKEYFREIGRKGGQRTARLYRELLSEFGKKGGRPRRLTINKCLGEEDQ